MTEYATPTQAANNIKNAHNNDTVASHAPARQIAVDHPPEHPKQIVRNKNFMQRASPVFLQSKQTFP